MGIKRIWRRLALALFHRCRPSRMAVRNLSSSGEAIATSTTWAGNTSHLLVGPRRRAQPLATSSVALLYRGLLETQLAFYYYAYHRVAKRRPLCPRWAGGVGQRKGGNLVGHWKRVGVRAVQTGCAGTAPRRVRAAAGAIPRLSNRFEYLGHLPIRRREGGAIKSRGVLVATQSLRGRFSACGWRPEAGGHRTADGAGG